MRDEKPTEQELDEVRDWITINTYHERYSMETHLGLWTSMTLREIAHEFGESEYDIYTTRAPEFHEHKYGIDKSRHSEIDTKYDLPGVDDTKVCHIHLDSVYIIDYNEFMAEGAGSFMWGFSNHKFGLLDSKREAAD